MLICCADFKLAGLHKPGWCCKTCHMEMLEPGLSGRKAGVHLKVDEKITERIPDLDVHVCCAFTGCEFTADEMMRVIAVRHADELKDIYNKKEDK